MNFLSGVLHRSARFVRENVRMVPGTRMNRSEKAQRNSVVPWHGERGLGLVILVTLGNPISFQGRSARTGKVCLKKGPTLARPVLLPHRALVDCIPQRGLNGLRTGAGPELANTGE